MIMSPIGHVFENDFIIFSHSVSGEGGDGTFMIIELLLKIEQVWMLFPGFTLLNEPDSGVYFIHVCQQCEVNSGNIISLASPPLPTNLLKLTLPSTSSRILNLSHEVRQQFQFYFYMYSFILLGVCKLCRGAYIRLRL